MTEIKYKNPTEDQIKLMEEFAHICAKAIDVIMSCEPAKNLEHASARIQESMGWFHTYVINGGSLRKDNKSKAN